MIVGLLPPRIKPTTMLDTIVFRLWNVKISLELNGTLGHRSQVQVWRIRQEVYMERSNGWLLYGYFFPE
jgi:hypothetical protein